MGVDTNVTAQQLVRIMHRECHMTLSSIAGAVGASRTAISQIYHGHESGCTLYPAIKRLCRAILANYEAKGRI